ncbi:MAG: HD domain-containing protein [Ilumatobacteraceae bacterium]
MAASTFTRMDESTAEQWAVIGEETRRNQPRVAERVLMLLRSLADVTDGFATDQLTHCLQTATLAERAGADQEVVVASLCHDVGKAVSVPNHGAIAAEMLKPYVRPDVYHAIKHHQDFQGRHYYGYFGLPTDLREQYSAEPWFALCEQFTDDWDQVAFDPDGPTEPLEHFEAMVREVFSRQRY